MQNIHQYPFGRSAEPTRVPERHQDMSPTLLHEKCHALKTIDEYSTTKPSDENTGGSHRNDVVTLSTKVSRIYMGNHE